MKKADYKMMKDLTCTCSMTIHILIHNYNYLVVFTQDNDRTHSLPNKCQNAPQKNGIIIDALFVLPEKKLWHDEKCHPEVYIVYNLRTFS